MKPAAMDDALGEGTLVGYCTNVHAGATLEAMLANLDRHARRVKELASPGAPLGIGLWLSGAAARSVLAGEAPIPGGARGLAAWMAERGLRVFTLNGFPQGDFHGQVVKRRVYEPDWRTPQRLAYTRDLVGVLDALLAEQGEENGGSGGEGSISTLPVGWGMDGRFGDEREVRCAADNLLALADDLAAHEDRTGRLIHVDLEPEPGCVLGRSGDVAGFFDRHLMGRGADERVRRYIRVCHDVCHAAVMFEGQGEAVARYASAGALVGKVQVSSALRVRFEGLSDALRDLAVHHLMQFHEPRYLHQTSVRGPEGYEGGGEGGAARLYEDLADAITGAVGPEGPRGEWRVHFHVPVYMQRVGLLGTTSDHIVECLDALGLRKGERAGSGAGVRHVEVETYAWDVLPRDLKTAELATGIAKELLWLRELGERAGGEGAPAAECEA